ncbi:MAG TPA: NUDIX hydrolase [Thermoplasmata archaeon]|jgi:ADP-ribose pyrophosphatase YjhB (NUDIX family)|nr:NUDIX hydrolase [Thermoplasmata archaeon]
MRRYRPKAPVPAVSALLLDGDRVLLIRRKASPNRGRWTFPGGTVQLGETLSAAVVREVREETGLAVEPLEVVDATDVIVPETVRPDYHFVLVVFRGRAVGGSLRAMSDAAEARWVPFSQLDELDVTETTRRTIEAVRAHM